MVIDIIGHFLMGVLAGCYISSVAYRLLYHRIATIEIMVDIAVVSLIVLFHTILL